MSSQRCSLFFGGKIPRHPQIKKGRNTKCFVKCADQNQRLSGEEINAILGRNTSGSSGCQWRRWLSPTQCRSAMCTMGEKSIFTPPKIGHKIESIEKNQKVSFTIVDVDRVVGEEYDTIYQSVVIFGMAGIIWDEEERLDAFRALLAKFSGNDPSSAAGNQGAGDARTRPLWELKSSTLRANRTKCVKRIGKGFGADGKPANVGYCVSSGYTPSVQTPVAHKTSPGPLDPGLCLLVIGFRMDDLKGAVELF